jgi:hypothetical protein
MKKTLLFSLLILSFLLAACGTGEQSLPQAAPASTAEVATPTPEIFIPLDPSPPPAASSLPLSCQVTDLKVFTDEAAGYCFAYPAQFALGEPFTSGVTVVGPALDENLDPLRASLQIAVQPVPAGSDLARLVDAYLSQSGFQDLPWTIERSTLTLAGEPAEVLAPVTGLGSARLLMALHDDRLYTLRFHPVDQELARPELDALDQTVTGSFAFVDGMEPSQAAPVVQTASWSEFGQTISLDYDPLLAPWLDVATVPAVPVSNEVMFSESHPAYVRFGFLGFQGGRVYDLPFLPADNRVAQVSIYQTADFPGFGDDNQFGFPGQLQALSDLLQTGVDSTACAEPMYAYEDSLPFLPWLNARQTFCAQPQILDFQSGKGLRYLTFYAQGPELALDRQIFYTFQGLSADGKFYISASFPVATGIFPNEPPVGPLFPDPAFQETMKEQVLQLNDQAADRFEPSLTTLNALVSSIRIGTP